MASFSSISQGMGSFFFTPYEGMEYITVSNGVSYSLPKILSQGLSIFAFADEPNRVRVTVQGSAHFDGQYFHLIGQTNGVIQYTATGKLVDKEALVIIDTQELSPGVLQLTLFDQSGKPQAERLLFVHPGESPNLELTVNRDGCEKRQQIDLEIQLTDQDKRGIDAELSISVTDPNQVGLPTLCRKHFYLSAFNFRLINPFDSTWVLFKRSIRTNFKSTRCSIACSRLEKIHLEGPIRKSKAFEL